MEHEKFMRRALELARMGGLEKKCGGVFGAVVVKDGQIVGEGYNEVIAQTDPTCHAEIQAIRAACKKLKAFHLEGCVLYTSGESCPMCLGAAYWAHIKEIYHASTVDDARIYGQFQDEDMFAEFKKNGDERKIKSYSLLRHEAIEIWKQFAALPDRAKY